MTGQPGLPPRAWIDIDLEALVENGRAIAAHAGRPLLPMVKADGYGVGAVAAARALESLDPWGFGVATVEEGRELRRAGISRPVVVFTPLLPSQLPDVRAAGLTPALHHSDTIRQWSESGLPWHLSIDTGMNRAGISWNLLGELRDLLRASPPEAAFTHLHSAELPDDSAAVQLDRFQQALDSLPVRPTLVHAENGAAVQRLGRSAYSLVRPGIFLYGVDVAELGGPRAQPVASIRARVVDLHDVEDGETVSYLQTYRAIGRRRIATLPLGYGDGYPRAASNRGWAMVNGRRATVAGLVTMDMIMLDVTDVPCAIGDIATLLGDPAEGVPDVAALAFHADMSPYELLTRLRGRLHRRYHGESPASVHSGEQASPATSGTGELS